MSALMERLAAQKAAAAESGVTPIRTGSASTTVVVGDPDGTRFPVVVDGVTETGLIRCTMARLIGVHAQKQQFLNKDTRLPETRNGEEDQIVLDTQIAVRAQIRLLNGDVEEPLMLETDVWSRMNDPILFIYGQQQGAKESAVEELRVILQEKFGWVARVEREGVERKRTSMWNLQSRGPVLPEQVKLPSGAIDVTTMVVRSTVYERAGVETGFKDFVSACFDNYDRWFTYATAAGNDEDARKVIDRSLTSLTGARTEVPEGQSEIQTFADRAGIGEFSLVTERNADLTPKVITPISLWKTDAQGVQVPETFEGPVTDIPF